MNGIEFTLKHAPANSFIGKKPAAVLFGDERIEVKSGLTCTG
ncbi:hypothetical protein FACS189425_02070 [Clostridia bacterium]|nr:hypothetical protein FACS189425_02070 [Clostridia bacterium]